MPRTPSRLQLYTVWLLLALAWGSSWSVLKLAFRDVGPFSMLMMRMGLASAACAAWALLDGGLRLPKRGTRRWLMLAMVGNGFLMNALLFWGGSRLDSGLTGLLFATTPHFAAAGATAMGLEQVRARSLAGIAVGLAGLLLVVGPALRGAIDGPGFGAILGAAFVCGITAALIKRHSTDWHIPSILALQFALNAGFGWLLHRLTGEMAPHWTPPALGALAYLVVICSVAAYAGVYWLYRHMSAVSTTMLVLADASFALLLGAFWLGEPMSWRILVAAVAVLGGFLLTVTGGGASVRAEPG